MSDQGNLPPPPAPVPPSLVKAAIKGAVLGAVFFAALFVAGCLITWAVVSYYAGTVAWGRPSVPPR
jgi:hypothetical protein